MKSKKASLIKIPLFLPPILFLALILAFTPVNSFADTDMVWTYDSHGGKDYSSLSTWEAHTGIDITSSNDVVVISHGGETGSIGNGETVTGADSGAIGTVVGEVTATQICIDVTSGDFVSEERLEKSGSDYVESTSPEDSLGVMYLDCYDGLHNDYVTIDGATTDSNHYRCIRSAADCTTPFAGKRETGAYFESENDTSVFLVTENYARLEHIGAKLAHNVTAFTPVFSLDGDYVKAIGCIAYDSEDTGEDPDQDIAGFSLTGNNAIAMNCIAHDIEPYGFRFRADTNNPCYAFNCTAVDNPGYGFRKRSGANHFLWNCVGDSNGTDFDDFDGGFHGDSDYNMSSDDTAPGTPAYVVKGKNFSNMWVNDTLDSENYHLSEDGAVDNDFKGGVNPAGTLNPPNYTLTDDIDEQTRSIWYRGSDEYGTRYVSSQGTNIYPYISWTTAANSIQDAIDQGELGYIVLVRAGDTPYSENIAMKDGVDLVKDQGDTTAIVGDGSSTVVVAFDDEFAIGCTLDGFEISNNGAEGGVYLHGTGTQGITNSTIIKNCLIHGNTGQGIELDGIGGTITAPIIDTNQIYSNSEEGILIIDASSDSENAIIRNNDIYNNTLAGINIGGASKLTIGDNNHIYENYAGIVFYVSANPNRTGNASSQPVAITGNEIDTNTKAGIAVIDYVTGKIDINYNKIHANTQAGLAIFNKCTADVTDNEVYDHTGAAGIFTGDWSEILPQTGTGFNRSNGPADLTIQRNKVYGNRAGMRLDHASGTISNNLVYGNSRGGIRFSGDNDFPYEPFVGPWGISVTMNNTVAYNGSNIEVIMDNTDGVANGTWGTDNTENSDRYGDDHRWHAAGPGSDTFTWTPTISTLGTYEVFAWWPSDLTYASAAPYTIHHDDGTTGKVMDQTDPDNGGKWVSLGIYSFDGEGVEKVVLTQTLIGKAIADAVRFTLSRGAGIAYDAIYEPTDPITGLARNFYDRPVGATQDAITIKNNILANNEMAGIKYCADNLGDPPPRSHNLFYMNFKEFCATGEAVDCGRMCRCRTLGNCNAPGVNCCDDGTGTWCGGWVWATGEICGEDPKFESDYRLQAGSPAIDAGDDDEPMGAFGGTDPITW